MSFDDIMVVFWILLISFWIVKRIRKSLGEYNEARKLEQYNLIVADARNRLIGWILLLVAMIFALVFLLFVK